MSLPNLNLQRSFFDTDVFLKRLFDEAPADRFRFFAEHVRPQLLRLRPQLAAMYCPDNGRPAEEPVRSFVFLRQNGTPGIQIRHTWPPRAYPSLEGP